MFNPIKMVLFDLDGTLIDSAPDLAVAINLMMQDLDRPQYVESTILQWIGNGSSRLVKRALTGELQAEPDPKLFENALRLFLDHYERNMTNASRIYDGVEQTLLTLQDAGIALACVTNKPGRFTEPLLEAIDLARFFSAVVSGDTSSQLKPHPEPLLYACEQMGAPARYAAQYGLMVGDSASDILAAKAINMPVVAVDYGYAQGKDLAALGADKVVSNLTEIIPLLN
ncbi:MAG: phosphoglycolate phosphatase [Arenicella sp.]